MTRTHTCSYTHSQRRNAEFSCRILCLTNKTEREERRGNHGERVKRRRKGSAERAKEERLREKKEKRGREVIQSNQNTLIMVYYFFKAQNTSSLREKPFEDCVCLCVYSCACVHPCNMNVGSFCLHYQVTHTHTLSHIQSHVNKNRLLSGK